MSTESLTQLVNQNLQHLVMSGMYLGMINAHLQENTIWARDGVKMAANTRLGQVFQINESQKAQPNQDPISQPNLSSTDITDVLFNGMTPKFQKHGHYELILNEYADFTKVNTNDAALAFDDTMEPAINFIAEGSGYTRDLQARRTQMQAYDNGRTSVTVADEDPSTILAVQNTNGFARFWKDGVPTNVSASNPIEVTITNAVLGTVTRDVIGCTPGTRDDNSDMVPGTIELSSAVAEIAVGDPVISEYATPTLLPNGKTTGHDIEIDDKISFLMTSRVTSWMMRSGIAPHEDGLYHFTGDTEHFNHFWEDEIFQRVFTGQYSADEVKRGKPAVINNILFQFSQRPAEHVNEAGITVRRALITGAGALTTGYYEKDPVQTQTHETPLHFEVYDAVNNCHHIIGKPIDVLRKNFTIAYNAYWGFAARTDSLAEIGAHPKSPVKRGVLILSS